MVLPIYEFFELIMTRMKNSLTNGAQNGKIFNDIIDLL